MTATTVSAPALPSGDEARPRGVLSLTAIVLGIATTMVSGALLAGYLNARGLARQWPPDGVELDRYLGVTLMITLLLASVTVEWAAFAVRRGNRSQAVTALVITLGLAAAFLNLLWYTGSRAGFGPGDHHFGVYFFAFLVTVGAAVGLATAFLLVALARTMGGQVTPARPDVNRAAAWYLHAVNLTWLVAFLGLYVLQNR